MEVIVTGATGFLGQTLCEALRRQGDAVTAVGSKDADLTRPGALAPYAHRTWDRIYHLAAWTQPGDFAARHKGEQFLINQQIDNTVLTWWMRHQPQAKLVAIGTSVAYPEGDTREEKYLDGVPAKAAFYYATAKRNLLLGQLALQEQFGLRHLTAVPSALYGPGYPVLTKRMNFVLDIAWKILEHKHAGSRIVLWGDGTQLREAVFVGDFVSALLALDPLVDNEVVNIGAGEGHTINEFANALCALAGVSPAALEYDPSGYVGAKAKILDNSKLNRLLPGRKVMPLRDGLSAVLSDLEPLVRSGRRRVVS
jgi:GDP-L-fucose synthase